MDPLRDLLIAHQLHALALGGLVIGDLFGFGMVFAGGCPSRDLARLRGGDLRSLLKGAPLSGPRS